MKFFFTSILITLTALSAHSAEFCQELLIGEAIHVEIPRLESKTNVKSMYSLFRKSDDVYEVFINPKFRTTFNTLKYSRYGSAQEVAKKIKSRVKKCLEKDTQKLTAKSETKIQFKVFDEERDSDKLSSPPPQVDIDISGPENRSDSANYNVEISCFIIKHEVLHLTGLVDEYVEKEKNFNSRAIGPADSIMSQGNGSILDHVRSYQLFPAHVRQILYPNCTSKNAAFQRCAKFAYDPSYQKKTLPNECQNGNWLK